jgi:serine/threonine-protein kinase
VTIPSRIGSFEVVRQIGSGGMGAVYLGRDPELNRHVAIKVVREEVHDETVLDRFFREARAAAALRHPNIITIYASGQHEHRPYIAMEFVDGESLADIIGQRRPLPLAAKLSYLDQLSAGLDVAHRAGIVHRDIKPANVMVDREGVVRILDFGIARIEGSPITQDGALIGSLNYMSPEQMLGRPVDHRSDIFSVGAVAYELLCYQQAFKGSLTDGLLQRLPHEDPPPLTTLSPGLPLALERGVMRALEKAPEKRFQSLAELRTALAEAQRTSQADEQRTITLPRPAAPLPSAPARSEPVTARSAVTVRPAIPPPAPAAASITVASLPRQSAVKPLVEPVGAPPSTQKWRAKEPPPGAVKKASAVKRLTSAAPPPAQSARLRKGLVIVLVCGTLVLAGASMFPWLPATPPSPLEREGPGIEVTMARYRSAYRNRDLQGVAAVFPTLPSAARRAMQRSFDQCLVYEVTFDGMQVALNPASDTEAQVAVHSVHTCTPNSGERQRETVQRELYTLRKTGGNWLIDGVERTPASVPRRVQ